MCRMAKPPPYGMAHPPSRQTAPSWRRQTPGDRRDSRSEAKGRTPAGAAVENSCDPPPAIKPLLPPLHHVMDAGALLLEDGLAALPVDRLDQPLDVPLDAAAQVVG